MKELLTYVVLHSLLFAIIYMIIEFTRKVYNKLLQSSCTLNLRLTYQDYEATYCKMALINEVSETTYFVVEFYGFKFQDCLTLLIPLQRPPIAVAFHIKLDRSKPKHPYFEAMLHPPQFKNQPNDNEEEFKVDIIED